VLLGKILRIDVNNGDPYSIPAGNPFAGQTNNRQEIWAYGVRNPWRFAFDKSSGLMYLADVGQDQREEVDVVQSNRAGVNYGWNITEGSSCYNASTCNKTGIQLPVLEYSHSSGACSITGGYVYRGTALPELAGQYFYSDYCLGFLKSFSYSNGAVVNERTWDVGSLGSVTSFGEDAAGELYILSGNGKVFRLSR
jgi:glucose/arabinose dehydrogenase